MHSDVSTEEFFKPEKRIAPGVVDRTDRPSILGLLVEEPLKFWGCKIIYRQIMAFYIPLSPLPSIGSHQADTSRFYKRAWFKCHAVNKAQI